MSAESHIKPMSEMALKRLITKAGRLQDAIEPLAKQLKEAQATIKAQIARDLSPAGKRTAVSGEYVADLSAECKERIIEMPEKRIILHDHGQEAFMRMSKLNMVELKKLYTPAELDAIAPEVYSGGGRRFTLTRRT